MSYSHRPNRSFPGFSLENVRHVLCSSNIRAEYEVPALPEQRFDPVTMLPLQTMALTDRT